MPYVRKRGRQVAIVHGERDSETGKVRQRILFTIYSKAEAYKIVGRKDRRTAEHFQFLLQEQYPGLKFNWKKIHAAILQHLELLPDLYQYRASRLQNRFRSDLTPFARQLILTDPQSLMSAAGLIEEHRYELEFISDLIQWRLKLRHQDPNQWNQDDPFYWRAALQGSGVPPETEELAASYYEKGRYEKAGAVFRLLLDCFPDYAEGHNYLGLIALDTGKLPQAQDRFTQAMTIGQKLFPRRLARKHYWVSLETRSYMRGLRNLVITLTRMAEYDEALSLCNLLASKCDDDITAECFRAVIYLDMGSWHQAAETAAGLIEIYPSESLLAGLAVFELDRPADAARHFIYGALNYPQTARLLLGQPTQPVESQTAVMDYNDGVSLILNLHGFLERQSGPSKQFFRVLLNHPRMAKTLENVEKLQAAHFSQDTQKHRIAFKKLVQLQTFHHAELLLKEVSAAVPL